MMLAFKPSTVLAPHVTDLWLWEIPAAAQVGDAAALTLLPDGHPTMVFNYGGALTASDGLQTITTRSALCGFQPRPVRVSCSGDAAGITVRFQPWGLARFVPGSLEDAAGRRVDCRELFSPQAVDDLEGELRALATPLARVRRVECFLLERLRAADDDALVRAVVQQLSCAGGATRVAELARSLGTSERTLARRFRRVVGAAPKIFSRVVRLQAALAAPSTAPPLAWSALAADAGYYDQSHLIRDMRELFGVRPAAFVASQGGALAKGFQALARETSLPTALFR